MVPSRSSSLAAVRVASAQTPPPAGPEFQVNVTSLGDQMYPVVAAESDRGYVVVWKSGTDAIYARRFDPSGAPRGAELRVDLAPGAKGKPSVAAHAGGGFLVAWEAPDADGTGVFARLYNSTGQPVGGEIAVNATTVGTQWMPQVAAGPYGYVVGWNVAFPGSPTVRLLSPNGTPLTGEIVVPDGSLQHVAAQANGFVVAWLRGGVTGWEVWMRRFDTAGVPRGSATLANGPPPPPPFGYPSYQRYNTRIAADAGGGFAITWWLWATIATGGFTPTAPHLFHRLRPICAAVRRGGKPARAGFPTERLRPRSPGWGVPGVVSAGQAVRGLAELAGLVLLQLHLRPAPGRQRLGNLRADLRRARERHQRRVPGQHDDRRRAVGACRRLGGRECHTGRLAEPGCQRFGHLRQAVRVGARAGAVRG